MYIGDITPENDTSSKGYNGPGCDVKPVVRKAKIPTIKVVPRKVREKRIKDRKRQKIARRRNRR